MTKKVISIVLAILIAIPSVMIFAGATSADVENVEKLITDFSGNMKTATPSDADLTSYNTMVEAWNKLSDSERDEVSVYSFSKLCSTAITYYYNQDTSSSKMADKYASAKTKVDSEIKLPSYYEKAHEIGAAANAVTNDETKATFLSALKGASANAIILAAGYNNSYGVLNTAVKESTGAKILETAASKISTYTQKADAANAPKSPSSTDYNKMTTAPKASKYTNGESDENYIADYKYYLAYKEAQTDYYVKDCAFKYEKHYLGALKEITAVATDFSYITDCITDAIEAKRNFDTSKDSTKINETLNLYNSLTKAQQGSFDSFSKINFYCEKSVKETTSYGKLYTYDKKTLSDLLTFCESMKEYYTVQNFEKVIADITEPYTSKDIAAAKEAYEAVDSALKSSISADTTTKYKQILAAAGPDERSEEKPDTSTYTVTNVSYNAVSQKNAEKISEFIVDLILEKAGVSDTNELVYGKIFTNETVGKFIKWLYPLLSEKTNKLINVTPVLLSNLLTEEKFAGAKKALETANEDWSALTVSDGDFGFKDGDVEGFLDGISASMRYASTLICAIVKFENVTDTDKGTYTYGAYEDLIDLLEILDLKSVMSSEDYTAYVKTADKTSTIVGCDARIRAILAPVAYLLVDFAKNPTDAVLEVLPKVSYAITSGLVNDTVNTLLSRITLVSIDKVDLTTAGIYKIVDEKLLSKKNIELSEEEFTDVLTALAGCGTAEAKSSVARGQSYRLGINADKSKISVVLVTDLLKYLHDDEALRNSVVSLIAGDKEFLGKVLNFAFKLPQNSFTSRCVFGAVSAYISFSGIFAKISNFFGNLFK